ncbi:5-formyltetrahydrofolate cyclo-ligase [Gammaproteobacteria bacterium]|nr:5-formyltetrahydrofolate cyclo-ligase [Gammaproteobacteria bacterium]
MASESQDLRQKLKAQRHALSAQYVAAASNNIAEKFWHSPIIKHAESIAIYQATAGEVDCHPLVKIAWARNLRVFAPILAGKQLKFAPLNSDSELTKNRFEILEPVYTNDTLIEPMNLDIVIVPLLAFDTSLNRLGMGAGYYDRTFAFSKQQSGQPQPLLVGIGYSFQQVAALEAQPWDVPMHVVITENECIKSH